MTDVEQSSESVTGAARQPCARSNGRICGAGASHARAGGVHSCPVEFELVEQLANARLRRPAKRSRSLGFRMQELYTAPLGDERAGAPGVGPARRCRHHPRPATGASSSPFATARRSCTSSGASGGPRPERTARLRAPWVLPRPRNSPSNEERLIDLVPIALQPPPKCDESAGLHERCG